MHHKTCLQCSKEFWTKVRKKKFCGNDCMHAAQRYDYWKALEVMWSKIDRNGPGGCWIWTRSTNNMGYGAQWMTRAQPMVAIHRLMYQLAYGNIRPDQWVLHKCDVPRCCNPQHLFLGNHNDNMQDMIRKGRKAVGERVKQSKLTADDVRDIRRNYVAINKMNTNTKQLAARYGVGVGAICSIIRGDTWAHVK